MQESGSICLDLGMSLMPQKMSLGSGEGACGRSRTEDVGSVSVLSTQILKLGLGCRWFIQEVILRSTSEGTESETRKREKSTRGIFMSSLLLWAPAAPSCWSSSKESLGCHPTVD